LIDREQRQSLIRIIEDDTPDLVELALELGRIPSSHGRELTVAQQVVDWLDAHGIDSWLQPILDESANAIGRLPGTDDGTSLIFNAHIDTGRPIRDDAPERARRIHGAWVEGDLLYGFGLVNDKAQLASFMIAARALGKAGIRLAGDLILSGVAFETGAPSVGSRQGVAYPGEGFGTWWMVNRGVTADYALVGETSGFGLVTAECGELGLAVIITGRRVYTPRIDRSATDRKSAIPEMANVVTALEEWATRYESESAVETDAGRMVPKAQILAIEGAPERTTVELDVRITPGTNPRAIARQVRDALRRANVEARVEPFQWSRGYVARGAEPLIDALTSAHLAVHGSPPPAPPTPEISMWRDVNIFNELGIPSICYGPPRQPEPYSDSGDRAMKVADLVSATKVYALAAVNVCGHPEGR
jgi:acetylornithine deacetylase/succinyl-diaminopimelate desuccinylase-like protein